jgi:hypothetical protein
MNAFGAVGYKSELRILDGHGFVTPGVADLKRSLLDGDEVLRSPGHDAALSPDYFVRAGYDPTYLCAQVVRTAAAGQARAEASRQVVARTLESKSAELFEGNDDAQLYVPTFHALPEIGRDPGPHPRILLLWERIEDGDPASAWAEMRLRLERYLATGEVSVIDMPTPPPFPPGLPTWP